EQERTILATLDPLAAMATVDADALDSLLAEVDLSVPGLAGLAAGLDAMVDRLEAADDRAANAEARVTAGPGAAKTHGPAVAERYLVVVECDTEKQQAALFRRLKKDGLRCRIETS
ncbi:MAG TPA: hypothetical protein VMW52_12930, partial [Phycisphaerae bacterium]|nr:hypothetical protein [Phycisphaerae bacterium]